MKAEFKDKMRKWFCDDKMRFRHEQGKWEVKEDNGFWKVMVRKCTRCGMVTNEQVMK